MSSENIKMDFSVETSNQPAFTSNHQSNSNNLNDLTPQVSATLTSENYNINWPALPNIAENANCDLITTSSVNNSQVIPQTSPELESETMPHYDSMLNCQEHSEENSDLSFNLYQRQTHIYTEENLIPPPPTDHHFTMFFPPINANQSQHGFPDAHPFPHPCFVDQNNKESYPNFAHIPPPVFYNQNKTIETKSEDDGASISEKANDEILLQIKVPSWAKLTLEDDENSTTTAESSSAKPRLVEYIGDQFHEKNPHTRRTILLNPRRSSENDPIVFYRFYQFSCPCSGKVWFSPLHRAREGCYCRDCHQFIKPFGHIDGLTPYLGHELCYAKFMCHACGRSWSCQKSKSNFPDNCFSCGLMIYPYYQVNHSVLRRKITRYTDNFKQLSRNTKYYSVSSSDSIDEEEYQIFENGEKKQYFQLQSSSQSMQSLSLLTPSNNMSKGFGNEVNRVCSATNASSTDNSSVPSEMSATSSTAHKLWRSASDTAILLGYPHRFYSKQEGRIGLRHHPHRK